MIEHYTAGLIQSVVPTMRVLISGANGLIGSELASHLSGKGVEVGRLVRAKSSSPEPQVLWNPVARVMDLKGLEGFDAVVHLAGDPIAQGRWTPEKKARIRESRVKGTRFLTESLARLSRSPKVFACASAIGFYGNRGDETLNEESSPGTGFLPEVGQQWEQACQPAAQVGMRVANLRFGIVLSPRGGALKMMLPPFRFGLGGRLGDGKQWMSWITLPDAAGAIAHVLSNEPLRGPVNIVSPNPVTNLKFTQALGHALRRPAVMPVPVFAVRILFGEMGEDLLLGSTRVEPKRLKGTGYRFRHPELEPALREMLS